MHAEPPACSGSATRSPSRSRLHESPVSARRTSRVGTCWSRWAFPPGSRSPTRTSCPGARSARDDRDGAGLRTTPDRRRQATTALDVMVQQQVLEVLAERVRDLRAGHGLHFPRLVRAASACDDLAVMYAARWSSRARPTRSSRTPTARTRGRWGTPSPDRGHAVPLLAKMAFPATHRSQARHRRMSFPPAVSQGPRVCSTTEVQLRPSGERRWSSCLFAPEVGT